MKILIKNGTIINAKHNTNADILISKNKILDINTNIITNDIIYIIDASNKLIFPGGIDAHVHLNLPTPAGFSTDNFYSGSVAAIFGGTTTIIDFVTPLKNQSLLTAFEARFKEAAQTKTNYSFHMSITSWNKYTAKEMEDCVKKLGITSFKTYMAYKGSVGINYKELTLVMQTAARLNALVTVHCENGDEITRLQKQFICQKKTSPLYHALSRPNYVESDTVKKVAEIALKTKCKVYIVHTSDKNSTQIISHYYNITHNIFSETCPQYLFLSNEVYKKDIPNCLKYVISPPIRSKSNQKYLWEAINNNIIQVVATDHCPFNTFGQKNIGISDFTKIPNGAGGIEHRLQLMFTYGFLKNKISLNKFVELTSTNPAKIFGMFPNKGVIEVGADADIVIWNPTVKNKISTLTQHQNCDSNIYENFKIVGMPETVILNGNIVLENFKLKSKINNGNFIKRNLPNFQLS